MDEKYVEVEGVKYVDDGTGNPKFDDAGNFVPFVEEKVVPYARFKDVNDKFRNLEQEISALKTKKEDGGLSTEQKKELEAKTYLKKLLSETLEETKTAETEREKAELVKFESEVEEVLSVNTDIKKDEFLKFIEEEASKYGIESIDGAMKLYRKMGDVEKNVAERTKRDMKSKPVFPSHEGSSGGETNDNGKSLWQIADEIISNLK